MRSASIPLKYFANRQAFKSISLSGIRRKEKNEQGRKSLGVCAGFKEGDKLVGKTVVVTGGNRGIGLEFVRQLADSDNTVLATCRNPEKATALRGLAESFPDGRVQLTQLDVLEDGSPEAWAKSLLDLGIAHVDVCINNAGVVGQSDYSKWSLEEMDAEEMLYCFKVNTIGPLLVVQQLKKLGLIGPPGSLVANMSSKVGSVDDNGSGSGYAYRASKAALNIVNKSLSIDLQGDKVACLLLHPGWVKTDMTKGRGHIDAATSAAGLIKVMEGEAGPLNGLWYDYAGKPIPW
mmetsp:Transcript_16624/g.22918  ORF Transcript_16624/g.22918 Transcript_16624/m.22918 type:complete len:291 (+) Transcript_16624:26-898(+)